MLYTRIMETIVENNPVPKIPMSAIFSPIGRLTDASVLIGNTRIHISVAMLIPEVAGRQLAFGYAELEATGLF